MNASLVKTLVSKAVDEIACAELDGGPEYAAEFRSALFNAAVQHINSEREAGHEGIPRSCYADGERVYGDSSSYSDDELHDLARDAHDLLAGLGLDIPA